MRQASLSFSRYICRLWNTERVQCFVYYNVKFKVIVVFGCLMTQTHLSNKDEKFCMCVRNLYGQQVSILLFVLY